MTLDRKNVASFRIFPFLRLLTLLIRDSLEKSTLKTSVGQEYRAYIPLPSVVKSPSLTMFRSTIKMADSVTPCATLRQTFLVSKLPAMQISITSFVERPFWETLKTGCPLIFRPKKTNETQIISKNSWYYLQPFSLSLWGNIVCFVRKYISKYLKWTPTNYKAFIQNSFLKWNTQGVSKPSVSSKISILIDWINHKGSGQLREN